MTGPSHRGRVHDDDVQDELLTIGRFARLCRLSVKQLRHYDDTGLLRPVHGERATGYRYYARDQAPDALTIALLRDIDVPIPVIAEVLAAGDRDRSRVLRAERDRLAARIDRDRERLALLDRLAADRMPGYDVTVVHEPARSLAVVSARSSPADVGARTGECVGRLLEATARGGTAWAPPLWGLFPLDLADGMTISVGVETVQAPAPPGTETDLLTRVVIPIDGEPIADTAEEASWPPPERTSRSATP